MPKKSNKKNKSGGRVANVEFGSDDDSVFNDNASMYSGISEGSNAKEESAEEEEIGQDELFEEKLKEAMDMATQKSANGRVNALTGLCKAFTKKCVPDFVQDRFVTITDIVERSVKKGKAVEQIAAANLSGLLCIQLGSSTSSEEVYNTLKPIFIEILNDQAIPSKARASVANALGLCCFIAGGEIAEVFSIMATMEKIFSLSYNSEKQDANTADILALHTACLASWSLLITMVPASHAYKMLESHMEHLGSLLDSPDVDLRITAGEAIVMLYINASEHDEDEAYDSVEDLIPKLKELATDSNKYRSKKDRKEQRSSFRDILKTIEDGSEYREKISFNTRESLELDGWFKKKHYDSLCKALSSGINLHMTENELIREVFGLGSPIPALSALQSNRPSKHQRQLVNNQAFKYRTQTRGKERDKRVAAV